MEARQDVAFELKDLIVDTVVQLYDVTKTRNIKGIDNKEIACPRCKSNGINLEEEIRKMFKLPCN